MRKLNKTEKSEATKLLSMLAVTLRIIYHLIIEAEKCANQMQRFEIRTKLLVGTLCQANALIQKAKRKLFESVYHQVDNAHIYSVDLDDIMCKMNYSEAYQHIYKLRMDIVDAAVKDLADGMYQFITEDEFKNK
ncbi:MAG: hypothetical protein K6E84_00255 [Lachnospiraceae bacterium]|nr:hypothetical protein [Lachnospiraceae bacterium]